MTNIRAYLREELEKLQYDRRLPVADRNQIQRELQRRADMDRIKQSRLRLP